MASHHGEEAPELRVFDPADKPGDLIEVACPASELPADHDVLDVIGAASLLRCSVFTLRQIREEELPTYEGPGKCVLVPGNACSTCGMT